MAYLRPVSPASDSSLDDLDLSILRQVKVAIQRVADVQTDEERGHNQLEAESIQTPSETQYNVLSVYISCISGWLWC